jgi:predicted ABC-type ATPase
MILPLEHRPVVVAVAGPNGAGKSTFYHTHLRSTGLRFVNADIVARELAANPYHAARLADAVRRALVAQRESFIFETVFSDPVGDKIAFLKETVDAGYNVVVCFIGLENAALSRERVAMRVSQGGHDVPDDKLAARYPRTLENLRRAIHELPYVLVFDNSDLSRPFQEVVRFEAGEQVEVCADTPEWFSAVVTERKS